MREPLGNGRETSQPVGPATHVAARHEIRESARVRFEQVWLGKRVAKACRKRLLRAESESGEAWAESRNGLADGETYLGPVHSQQALINTCFGYVSYLYLGGDRKEVWDR